MSSRTLPPAVAHSRGRVAALSRSRPANDPELLAAKSELAAANLEAYVRRIVEAAPPLTADQREAILAAFAGFKVRDAA